MACKIEYRETFTRRGAAEEFIHRVERSYPPQGYGTTLNVYAMPDGTYAVIGRRWSSCD